jgi:rhodanese-related sulfurtransferase
MSWIICNRLAGLVLLTSLAAVVQTPAALKDAVTGDAADATREVSTGELKSLLAEGGIVLIDARPALEYAISHIPGAVNVAPKPGVAMSLYVSDVAEIGRLVHENKSAPLVLYCNGQYCQASRTISDQLVAAGFTNVRRYQLGIPMWRALNGPVEIELEGILRVYKIDQTAVFFDARTAADFAKVSLSGTHNVPVDQLATDGLRKAPMPSNDFNTRIVLFGRDFAQARALADAVGKTPFQNVSYFPGTFEALAAAVKTQ